MQASARAAHPSPGWRCTSRRSHAGVVRIQFLAGCWTEGLRCLLLLVQVQFLWASSWGSSENGSWLPWEWVRQSERASKTDSTPVAVATSRYIYSILFIRSKSLGRLVFAEKDFPRAGVPGSKGHRGPHPGEELLSLFVPERSPFHRSPRSHKGVMLGLLDRQRCHVGPWTSSEGRKTWWCGNGLYWKKKKHINLYVAGRLFGTCLFIHVERL